MATGFTQRFKGKIIAQALFLGPSPFYGPGSVGAYSTAAATGSLALGTLGLEGIQTINASSGISVWQMSDLPAKGVRRILDLTVSSAAQIKVAAGASFDASTDTVIKSTYSQRISLIGLSSLRWSVTDVYPDTTAGGAPVGGITLSTTT